MTARELNELYYLNTLNKLLQEIIHQMVDSDRVLILYVYNQRQIRDSL